MTLQDGAHLFSHPKLTGNFSVGDTFAPNWGAPTALRIDDWHFSTARILIEDGICLRDLSWDGVLPVGSESSQLRAALSRRRF